MHTATVLHKNNNNNFIIGVAYVLIAAVAFSAKAIFVKLAYASVGVGAASGSLAAVTPVDPVTLLTLRMVLALPFFALMAWYSSRGAVPLSRRDWLALLGLGLMGYYGASLFDFWGLQYISASLERLILFLNPTFVVLLSAVLFGRNITRNDLLALALCYLGIGFVFAHDVTFHQNAVLLGSTLVFISAILYAGYLVGAGQVVQRVGSLRFASYASIVSTFGIVLQFLLTRPFTVLQQPARVWMLSGAMAIISTVLPVVLMAEGVRRIGSSNAAMIGSIGPVATIFMGFIFLHEPITLLQIIGAALVMAGVLTISLKKR
jgi:drug/metabolite transporter (DMT)-like permease